MSERVDTSEGGALVTTIARLQADLREIRSRQPVDRQLVKRSYVVQTTTDFDLIDDPVPANSYKVYRINLLTTAVQLYPYAIMYMEVYNNGRAASNLLSSRGLNDATGTGYTWKPRPSNVANRMDWSLAVSTGSSAASISMKFRAISTAPADRVFISW